jgi:hypothetical protein
MSSTIAAMNTHREVAGVVECGLLFLVHLARATSCQVSVGLLQVEMQCCGSCFDVAWLWSPRIGMKPACPSCFTFTQNNGEEYS